jgi:hypothetical protein
MPDDPTTLTPAPTDSAATGGATSQGNAAAPVQSSREMANAGVNLDAIDWQAKYNGLVGTYKARTNQLGTEIDRLNLLNTELTDKVTQLQGQITDLTNKVNAANALQSQLDTANGEKQAALDRANRLDLLTKFPSILSAQVKADDGTVSNPLLDIIMGSNLPIDDLKTKAAQLAASLQVAQPATTGGNMPPMPAPVSGDESPEVLQQKAMDAHNRWIKSGKTDAEAKAEADRMWELHRKAKKKSN